MTEIQTLRYERNAALAMIEVLKEELERTKALLAAARAWRAA